MAGTGEAPPPVDLAAVAELVAAFESASVDTSAFHHREHMLVALWFIAHHPEEAALERMRAGLHRLLARIGRDAYHETITVFWMRVLRSRLALTDPSARLDVRFAQVLDWCDTSRPLNRHYSAARLNDPAARRAFVDPDIAPLPAATEARRLRG